jgi:integrase
MADWAGDLENKAGHMNHLERHEVLAVLRVAREHSELDWLLFCIQYIHSHRISEVLSLTPENFDVTADGGFCTVQRLKGSLKTTQPLVTHDNPLLNELPAVTQLLSTLGPKERLFGTLKKQNQIIVSQNTQHLLDCPSTSVILTVFVTAVRCTRLGKLVLRTSGNFAVTPALQAQGIT